MRRFLLSLGLLLLLFSCATAPEPEEAQSEPEQVARPEAAEDEEAPVPPEPEGEAEEPEPPEAPEPEPEPLTLQLINPSNPRLVDRAEFLLSALPSEGTLRALEIELLSGPLVAQPSEDPFGIVELRDLAQAERRYTVAIEQDPMRVRIPPGFVDGASYGLRLRGVLADDRTTEWMELEPTLDLDLRPPELTGPPPTVDTTPVVTVTGEQPVQVIVDGEVAFTAEEGGELEFPFALSAGSYRLQARALSEDGYLTRSGSSETLRIVADARPVTGWPVGGQETLRSRVGLHWSGVEGGVAYQARYRLADSDSWQQLNPTADEFAAVPESLPAGERFEWQVRVQNDAGTWFSWSPSQRFVAGEFPLDFAAVVREEQPVTFARGYEDGSRDEQPVREIRLTRPFAMAVTPLTNAQLVRLVRFAETLGFVRVEERGVWTVEDEPRPLVGLSEMDYGQQFGLVATEEGLVVRDGYGDHPAVGVTWLGAVQIANLLSWVEGLPLAYDVHGALSGSSGGYRLPTEAEWEYAARGSTQRIMPWGGSLSGRVANYYRSFDPFEDVNEPFTGNNGPTNPVGFFDGSARDGFQTASDASPFGIRDMVGNVWEWCYDRYDPGYYGGWPEDDPAGPDEADAEPSSGAVVLAVALDPNQRVVRGTAWNSREPDVRLTNRGRYSELGRSYSIGVRLVRDAGR